MVNSADLKPDLSLISIREYRALFDKDQPQAEEDATIAKSLGISVEELLDLSQPEYRRLCKAFFDAARAPLADPNSVSGSSSQ